MAFPAIVLYTEMFFYYLKLEISLASHALLQLLCYFLSEGYVSIKSNFQNFFKEDIFKVTYGIFWNKVDFFPQVYMTSQPTVGTIWFNILGISQTLYLYQL